MEGKENYNQVWKIVNAAITAHGILRDFDDIDAQAAFEVLDKVVGKDAPKLYIESEDK